MLRIAIAICKAAISWARWNFISSIMSTIRGWWRQVLYDYVEHPSIVRCLKRRGYIALEKTPASVSEIAYTKDTLKALDRVLLERFNFMQFGVSPEDARYLLVKPHIAGFSSQVMESLTTALIFGYMYNRTVLFDDPPTYLFPFKPITNHAMFDIEKRVDGVFQFLPSPDKILRYNSIISRYVCLPLTTLNSINMDHACERLPYQRDYVTGLLLTSFLKLQEEYGICIERCKKEIGFPSDPVIGCHIRCGDRVEWGGGRKYLASYIRCIEALAEITASRTIYVATDDSMILKQLPVDSGLNFIYDNSEKRYDNLNCDMVTKNKELRGQETMTAVKNIYLLGDCDHIIGASGHFSFYANAISYHRNKKMSRIHLAPEQGRMVVRCKMTGHQDELKSALMRQGLPVKQYHDPFTGFDRGYRPRWRRGEY